MSNRFESDKCVGNPQLVSRQWLSLTKSHKTKLLNAAVKYTYADGKQRAVIITREKSQSRWVLHMLTEKDSLELLERNSSTFEFLYVTGRDLRWEETSFTGKWWRNLTPLEFDSGFKIGSTCVYIVCTGEDKLCLLAEVEDGTWMIENPEMDKNACVPSEGPCRVLCIRK